MSEPTGLGGGLSPAAAAPVPDRGLSIRIQVLRREPAGCHPGVPGELPSGQEWELAGDANWASHPHCHSRSWPVA